MCFCIVQIPKTFTCSFRIHYLLKYEIQLTMLSFQTHLFLSISVIKTVSEAIAVSCNETKPLHCCICDVEESWETPFCCENWLWKKAISWALFACLKIYSPGHEAVFLSPCKRAGGILSHSICVTRRKRQLSDVNLARNFGAVTGSCEVNREILHI